MPDNKFLQSLQSGPVQQEGIWNVQPTLSNEQLSQQTKYPTYFLGRDNEDLYGRNQSWFSQIGNGFAKGVGTAGSTFLQGTAGLVYGTYKWIDDGQFTSFYDNDFTKGLNDFSKSMETSLPNYYTAAERDMNSFRQVFTANFWGDSIIKNMGFAAGAYLSGAAWAKGVSALSKGLAGGGGAAGAEMQEVTSLLTREAGSLERITGNAQRVAQSYIDLDKAKNIGYQLSRAGIATAGEASIEAYQAKEEYRNQLLNRYKDLTGQDAEGAALESIESDAAKLGNIVYGANTALLTATNFIQFPKIAGAFWKAERAALSGAERGVNDIVLRNATGEVVERGTREALQEGVRFAARANRFGKAKAYGSLLFSPSEAFEEGSQFVIPFAAKDYLDAGREGKDQSILNSIGKGVKELVTTKEGQTSLLVGGLSGGLMQNFNPFGAKGFRGIGASVQQYNQRKRNTETFVNQLNETIGRGGYLGAMDDSLSRGIALEQRASDALRRNNRLGYEDTRNDRVLNYLLPRIQYGRYDLVKDDLEGLTSAASTEEGFTELQSIGQAPQDVTREDYISNLQELSRIADTTNTRFEEFNRRYKNDPRFNNESLLQLAYVGGKIDNYNNRISQLLPNLTANGIIVSDLMARVHSEGYYYTNSYTGKSSEAGVKEEEVQALFNQIDGLIFDSNGNTISPETKDDMKQSVSDLLEISARREYKIREYEEIKKNPELYRSTPAPISLAEVGEPDMSQVNFNEVEEEQNENDHQRVWEAVLAQTRGENLTDAQRELLDNYPLLTVSLIETASPETQENIRKRAEEENWHLDTNGNPVPPTAKSQFFDANEEGNYTMEVNGIQRDGILDYLADTDTLYFRYTNEDGSIVDVPVYNEDFNDGTIVGENDLVQTPYLTEEDTTAPSRTFERVRQAMSEITQRQNEIESQIQEHLNEIGNLYNEVQAEQQKTGQEVVENLQTLSEMKREVEQSYEQLVAERQNLETQQATLQTILDSPPVSLRSSVELLEKQQRDVAALIQQNSRLLPSLQRALSAINDLVSRFTQKVISRTIGRIGTQTPAIQSVQLAFESWERTGQNEDLNNLINTLNSAYQGINDFSLAPFNQQDTQYLNNKLREVESHLRDIEPIIKAKQAIIERLNQEIEDTTIREELVRTNPRTKNNLTEETADTQEQKEKEENSLKTEEAKFKNERKKSLLQEGNTSQEATEQANKEWEETQSGKKQKAIQGAQTEVEYDEDGDRIPISRIFNSSVLLPTSMRNQTWDKRLNNFISRIGAFDRNRRPNLRLLAVTRNNEESLGLKGFIDKYFQVTPSQSESGGYEAIASDYLLSGGLGVVLSTDYLLQGLAGTFTKANIAINEIRNSYAQELADKNLTDIKNLVGTETYGKIMSEVREAINQSYQSSEAQFIFDEILKYPTGLPNKLGNEISIRVDRLNEQTVSDNNPASAPIGLVLVEETENGLVFLDESGQPLPQDESLVDKVLLSKMREAKLTYTDGTTQNYSDPTNLGEEFAQAKRSDFEDQRKEILNSPVNYTFTFKTSYGRSQTDSRTKPQSITETLITTEQLKAKKPVISVLRRENQGQKTRSIKGLFGGTVKVPIGSVVLRTDEVLQVLSKRDLSPTEKRIITEALLHLAENPTDTEVKKALQGMAYITFGENMETVNIGNKYQFNLTSKEISTETKKGVYEVAATIGMETVLQGQMTNASDTLLKENAPFQELIGFENGPQFKEWGTYQEYLLSDEDGRSPLYFSPNRVDKYLIFQEVEAKVSSTEETAEKQVNETVSPQENKQGVVAKQEGLINRLKALLPENQVNTASDVILRTASIMVDKGIFQSVEEAYNEILTDEFIDQVSEVVENTTEEKSLKEILDSISSIYYDRFLTPEDITHIEENSNGENPKTFFQRGFVDFINETDKSPTSTFKVRGQGTRLQEIWKGLRQYVIDLYQGLTGNGLNISTQMKQLYQDMLGLKFQEQEAKRKGLKTKELPQSLIQQTVTAKINTKNMKKGESYKILGISKGVGIAPNLVTITNTKTKETILATIPEVISQTSEPQSKEVVRKEKKKQEVVQPSKAEVVDDSEIEVIQELPKQEVIAKINEAESVKEGLTALEPETKTVPIKKESLKRNALVGVKTEATPEDANGGVFLKNNEVVYVVPYFNNTFVQVDENTFKAYNKAPNKQRGITIVNKSRSLGTIKKGSSVSLTQTIEGMEKEVEYTVQSTSPSSIIVKPSYQDQTIEIQDVSMLSGAEKAFENQIKTAFINSYIGEPFQNINDFLNPKTTVIEESSLPEIDLSC